MLSAAGSVWPFRGQVSPFAEKFATGSVSLVLFLLLLLSPAYSASQNSPAPPGDADGDGYLTPFDLQRLLRHILGQESASDNADANQDGHIDIADWVKVNGILFPVHPSLLLPAVHLVVTPGQLSAGGEVQVHWEVTGLWQSEDVQLLLRVREPGTVVSSGDELTFTPGVIPGNGQEYYRAPEGDWSETEAVFTNQTSGETVFALPTDSTGEWGIQLEVQDQDRTLAIGQDAVIVGTGPTLRLFLNRPRAGTTDEVELQLETTPGEEPEDVVILAQLVFPDETRWSLPGGKVAVPVHEGVSQQAEYSLLGRHFAGMEQGLYRVEVKLYKAAGGLLGLANAGFEVCDVTSEVNGTLKNSDGSVVNASGLTIAEVRALDIDDARLAARSAVDSNGSFQLNLEAGRYVLIAAAGGEGALLTGHGALIVDCSGEDIETDLSLDGVSQSQAEGLPPLEKTKTNSAGRVLQQTGSQIPNPKLFVNLGLSNLSDAELEALSGLFIVELSARMPETDITTSRDLQALVGLSEAASLLGNEVASQETIEGISGALGSEFVSPLSISKTGDCTPASPAMDCQVHIEMPIINSETATVVRRISKTFDLASGDLADIASDLPAFLEDQTQGLQNDLEASREAPVVPTLTLELDKEVAEEGDTVKATLTIEEIDGNPAPAGKSVTIVHASDSGSISRVDGLTNAQGTFQATFSVFSGSHAGIVTGVFRRFGRVWDSPEAFYTAIPSDTAQALRIAEPYPVASLKPGETGQIRVEAVSSVPGMVGNPLPFLTGIQAVADNGTVSPPSGTTDANGIATFTFTAGTQNGAGKVVFQRQVSGPGVDPTVVQTAWYFAITADAVLNVNTTGGQGGSSHELFQVDPNRAVSITADLRVGEDRLAGLPVVFRLDGEGEVSMTQTSTDVFGLAQSFFLPPVTGSGVTVMCGDSIIDSITLSDCVNIDYEAQLAFTATLISASGSVYSRMNILDQIVDPQALSIWLPEPAYGLPAGLNQFPLPPAELAPEEHDGFFVAKPIDINDSGQVLVFADYNEGTGGKHFVWQNGTFTELESRVSEYGDPLALNNLGQITGEFRIDPFATQGDPDYPPKAFFLSSPAAQAVALSDVGGIVEHRGSAMNDQGDVIGSGLTPNDFNTLLAWFPGGQIVGDFPGLNAQTMAINNQRKIVFSRANPSPGVPWGAYLWQNGQITDLGTLGGPFVGAQSINNLGLVVGQAEPPGGQGRCGFLWVDGQMLNLNDLLVGSTKPVLIAAFLISDSNTILAIGYGPNFGTYLLKPVGAVP